jgi:hypothetical protein
MKAYEVTLKILIVDCKDESQAIDEAKYLAQEGEWYPFTITTEEQFQAVCS